MDGKAKFGWWQFALLASVCLCWCVPSHAQQNSAAAPPASVARQAAESSPVDLVRADKWLAVAWKGLADFWSYPLTTVDDHPITIGQVVAALVLFSIGYIASRWMSWSLGQHLTQTVGMHESASAALQTVSHYIFVSIAALAALQMASVPLGVFAYFGGAVAIGIGFGSQNIMNNFISGLILLAERPVRVGDRIQIDQLYGTVELIGTRSTRVRTEDNLEIIVPNSTLLQANLINWTLTDDRVRATIKIGVAYGSPTRVVSELLEQAAKEQPEIVREPAPVAKFDDFGDNALMFKLHFWLHVHRPVSRSEVESEIRHRINELLDDAGIVIAFPQRDVHLKLTEPVDVRIAADYRPPLFTDTPPSTNRAA